ncbi:MAG: phage major capsid protein [Rhizomicrobium sp.]
MDYETKAASPEVKDAFDDFLRAFESFKGANDERLAALERRSGDVVTEEKVDRIDKALVEQKRALDALLLDAARPALSGERKPAPDRDALERKSAFDRYVRKGDAGGLDALELKSAFSAGSPGDGGYTVPLEIEQTIDRVLAKASPIRAIATVRQIGGNVYRKPIATAGAATGWVAETADRPQTDTPTLSVIDFPAMELYAMPAATATLLDDSQVDIERWLAGEVQIVFAEQEGAAFVNGNGTTAPKGFLSETIVADASWVWAKLGYVASGADGAFAASNPTDALVTLAYAPRQGYRANGTWVMNRKTESVIRKFKDSTGNYIWSPAAPPASRRRCWAIRWRKRKTCRTSPRAPMPWPSAISPAAIWWSIASASAPCAIPIRPSPMCCSTPPSASAAASRITKPSS